MNILHILFVYMGGSRILGCRGGGCGRGVHRPPPLFNIYHDGVMEDFRVRRRVEAHKRKWEPGLAWEYKVDGRIVKKALLRKTKEGG